MNSTLSASVDTGRFDLVGPVALYITHLLPPSEFLYIYILKTMDVYNNFLKQPTFALQVLHLCKLIKLHILTGALHWKMSQTFPQWEARLQMFPQWHEVRTDILLAFLLVGIFAWKTRWRSHRYHYNILSITFRLKGFWTCRTQNTWRFHDLLYMQRLP